MPILTLPRSFFVKERENAYGDWKEAYWRELLQNSLDAGATEIDIQVTTIVPEGEAPKTVIEFCDNGCGMSKKTMIEVFFALGESYKPKDESIGGFGRARILTCFSMDEYTIVTNDGSEVHAATGSGATYDLVTLKDTPMWKGKPLERGTIVGGTTSDATHSQMIGKLLELLSTCNLPVKIKLNDKEVDQKLDFESFQRAKNQLKCKDEPFADIYYKTGPDKIYVRVKGLTMFSIWANGAGKTVLFDLLPEKANKVLTSNRDGFHYLYDEASRKFIAQMTQDSQVLDNPEIHKWDSFEGAGAQVVQRLGHDYSGFRSRYKKSNTPKDTLRIRIAEILTVDPDNIPEQLREAVERLRTGKKLSAEDFLPDIPIYIKHKDPKVEKAAEAYHPRNWNFILKGNEVLWQKGHREIHLYYCWKAACQLAARALVEMPHRLYGSETPESLIYSSGFLFSHSAMAMHVRSPSKPHYLLLNPLNEKLEPAWDLRKALHVQNLLATALHETAHTCFGSHHEAYANVLTDMMAVFPWEIAMKHIGKIKL